MEKSGDGELARSSHLPAQSRIQVHRWQFVQYEDSSNVYKYRSLIVNLIQDKLLVHRIGLGQVLGSVAWTKKCLGENSRMLWIHYKCWDSNIMQLTIHTVNNFVLLQRRAVRILWGIPLFSEDLHTSTKSKLNSSKLEPKQTLEFKSEKEICDFSLIYWFLLVNWLWIFFIYSCNLFAALTSSVEDSAILKYIPERIMGWPFKIGSLL